MRTIANDDDNDGRSSFFAGVVEAILDTPKALLCKSDKREEWVPKSAIHDDSEVYKLGHKGKLVVFEWFAAKEGWIDGKPTAPQLDLGKPKCRSCGAEIEWRKTEAGKNTPYDLSGTPHWATCPSADRHRKARP